MNVLAGEERTEVERRGSGRECSQRGPGRLQLQLQVRCGRLDEDRLEDVRVHSLQEDGVSQDSLKEGRVNNGRAEVIIVNPVLGPVEDRGRGELGVTNTQSQAATWK